MSEEKLNQLIDKSFEEVQKEFVVYKNNLSKIPFGEDIITTLYDYAEKDAKHNFDVPFAFEFCEPEKQIVLQRVSKKCNCSLEVLENSWNRLMTEYLWGDGKTIPILDMRDTNITFADYRYGGWI